jgi:Winged helix-turn helix
MPRPFGSRLVLAADLRDRLQTLARASSTPQALAFRCRIILRAAAPGHPTNQEVAAALDCDRHTVGLWRERFAAHGLAGLQDAPRPGRPRAFSPAGPRRRRQPGFGKHRRAWLPGHALDPG